MEYRMYFLVLRHLSGINKAVQTSHAIAEYCFKYHNNTDFQDYLINDKTIIMLDGGTHLDMCAAQTFLTDNEINHAYFIEPDINNAMTAICFLVDERVWNYKFEGDGIIEYTEINEIFELIGGPKNLAIKTLIENKRLST